MNLLLVLARLNKVRMLGSSLVIDPELYFSLLTFTSHFLDDAVVAVGPVPAAGIATVDSAQWDQTLKKLHFGIHVIF